MSQPTIDETLAIARQYLDCSNRDVHRMSAGVVLMAERIAELERGLREAADCLESSFEVWLRDVGERISKLVPRL